MPVASTWNWTREVGSGLIARVLNPVFGHIANTLVDAFVKEAERRYGPGFGAS